MNFALQIDDNWHMSELRRLRYAIVTVAVLVCLLGATNARAASNEGAPSLASARRGPSGWPALTLPILHANFAPAHQADGAGASGSDAGVELERAKGWTVAGFPLGQMSYGVYVQVRGRSELGRVEVLYDDGTLERVEPVSGHVYGAGIYELARFTAARHVALVRMKVRAASALARIKVLVAPEPI
jgi:hypothetical protein